MEAHEMDAQRPSPEHDDRARLRRAGCRLLGRIAKQQGDASSDGGEGLSDGNGGDAAAWDPLVSGLMLGRKELDRIDRERKDIPGVARAIDLGGAGLQYDDYIKSVLKAKDLEGALDAMTPEDRKRYGPPSASV